MALVAVIVQINLTCSALHQKGSARVKFGGLIYEFIEDRAPLRSPTRKRIEMGCRLSVDHGHAKGSDKGYFQAGGRWLHRAGRIISNRLNYGLLGEYKLKIFVEFHLIGKVTLINWGSLVLIGRSKPRKLDFKLEIRSGVKKINKCARRLES